MSGLVCTCTNDCCDPSCAFCSQPEERPAPAGATQEEMAEGHLFEISMRSWTVFGIDPGPFTQCDWTLPPVPVQVRAWNLADALRKAAELPLHVWFKEEDECES